MKELLTGFFSETRPCIVRRLWIESCSLDRLPIELLRSPHTRGLESVRLRRLSVFEDDHVAQSQTDFSNRDYFRLTRAPHSNECPSPNDGDYNHTTRAWRSHTGVWKECTDFARECNKAIFNVFPDIAHAAEQVDESEQPAVMCVNPTCPVSKPSAEPNLCSSFSATSALIDNASETLTSLALDWTLDVRELLSNFRLQDLYLLNLKAFQVRDAFRGRVRLPMSGEYELLGEN